MEGKDLVNILYVDDEQINLDLFKFNFRNKYHVFTASSGNDGLELLKLNNNIAAVISDMKMPGMSGIEFIKLAKMEYQNIAFFILTGFDITPEISAAIENRLINKYFRKPFNIHEIESSIYEAFELE